MMSAAWAGPTELHPVALEIAAVAKRLGISFLFTAGSGGRCFQGLAQDRSAGVKIEHIAPHLRRDVAE
jgi:hypothetical protein